MIVSVTLIKIDTYDWHKCEFTDIQYVNGKLFYRKESMCERNNVSESVGSSIMYGRRISRIVFIGLWCVFVCVWEFAVCYCLSK